MSEARRYTFETCDREGAIAEVVSELRMYWVRLDDGSINRWFEREGWPEGIEFVRPVEVTTQ